MLRGGAFKPRTSPYAFQGLGEEGLKMLAAARDETGLPIVTEVMDPRDLDVVCEYADVLQVGARNMQNFPLLAEVGKVGKPVLLKRGIVDDHRGVADGGRVHRQGGQPRRDPLRARHPHLRDGHAQHARHQRRAGVKSPATCRWSSTPATPPAGPTSCCRCRWPAVAAGADGVIVETHPNPEHALCDGPQSLPHGGLRRVRRAACATWSPGPARRSPDADERTPRVSTVAVIGVGLMGGSLGLAARQLAGVARGPRLQPDAGTLDLALERGAITEACGSLEEAAAGADLVFVCTPVRLVVEHVRGALAAAPPHAVVSDVGSTKGPLMRGAHAATSSGAASAGTRCAAPRRPAWPTRAPRSTTAPPTSSRPGAHVDADAFQLLYGFLATSARGPVAVDPDEHDRLMAVVSHLPHVLANVLMSQAGQHAGRATRCSARVRASATSPASPAATGGSGPTSSSTTAPPCWRRWRSSRRASRRCSRRWRPTMPSGWRHHRAGRGAARAHARGRSLPAEDLYRL